MLYETLTTTLLILVGLFVWGVILNYQFKIRNLEIDLKFEKSMREIDKEYYESFIKNHNATSFRE